MDEALMLNREPPAHQKHWISHKIGDKVLPNLHACIRPNQSLMQGLRLQQEESLILGQRMVSIKTKLETILQPLQKPPNLSLYNVKDHFLKDASVSDPVTPIKYLPPSTIGATSAPSDWFKLSFDKYFWNEHYYASPGPQGDPG
jgi:hypothetical protein